MDELIIDKLRQLRKSKNMTQEQLAEKIGISRSKVSSWETNKRCMNIIEAIKLAQVYEASLDNLFAIPEITAEEYVKISDKFIKDKRISFQEKVRIIELIRNSLKAKHVDELYENYKMTQNATK